MRASQASVLPAVQEGGEAQDRAPSRKRSLRPELQIVRSIAAGLAFGFFSCAAWAQANTAPPPVFSSADANGVDLATGKFTYSSPAIAIGQPGAGGLSYSVSYTSGIGWRDNLAGTVNSSGNTYTVSIGGKSETFTYASGTFTSKQRLGASLATGGPGLLYITGDGTIYGFEPNGSTSGPEQANASLLATVTKPDGEVLTYTYDRANLIYGVIFYDYFYRAATITSSLGYRIIYSYGSNDSEIDASMGETADAWSTVLQVEAQNLAFDAPPGGWPHLTFTGYFDLPTSITDNASHQTSFGYGSSGDISVVQTPEGRSITVQYYIGGANAGRVSSVTDGQRTWSYNYVDAGGVRTTTVSNPGGGQHVVTSTISTGLVASDTNELGKTTSYLYDTYGHVTRVTLPEGNNTQYTYDTRGNVTQTKMVAKAGSGLADIITSAVYPPSCSGSNTRVMCNKPTSTTNARGFRTDYTYNTTHGGVLTVTSPAPSGSTPIGSGTRPKTTSTYTAFSSYYRTGPTTWTNGAPVWRLTKTSSCSTGASCTGTDNEVVLMIDYPGSTTPNNVMPVSTTAASGDGTPSATTTITLTALGDVATADGPLANDTTRTYYDATRRVIGIVGPDPDGAGPLKRRATRTVYNNDDQATQTEQGTVNDQGDNAFASFAVLTTQMTAYDSLGRAVGAQVVKNATVVSLVQYGYDAAGRIECSALRMNSSEFASPPTSACDDAPGGSYADRIVRAVYNPGGQTTQKFAAFDTIEQQTAATLTYTNNGLVATSADAMNNLTTYTYDGHDQLVKISYPSPSTPGQSSTTDYEQFTYNYTSQGGLRMTERHRDNQLVTFTYDNLSRITLRDVPAPQPDVSTTYDLLSRVLTVSQPGHALSYAYDALGRVLSETGPLGVVAYEYDSAGQRTRMDYPNDSDSATLYVRYIRDDSGAITEIREKEATSGSGQLAVFGYDDLGRRTSFTRAGSANNRTTYAYHSAADQNFGRLASFTIDNSGTGDDLSVQFQYNAAGQIVVRQPTTSNVGYLWTESDNRSEAYGRNGLDQYTSVTPNPGALFNLGYSTRGDLIDYPQGGAFEYGFDADGRLISTPGGVTFSYDPLGRLYQITSGSTVTRFLYDGSRVVAEYDGSNQIVRRYVHGPGIDEPLVRYDGDGLSAKRWLLSDERGSIVGETDSAGALQSIRAYDLYGQSSGSYSGRFQYTGQMWIAEAQLYHFKARTYDPRLGRFLQPDPIGAAGGPNSYAYAGNDPINASDPTGLVTFCSGSRIGAAEGSVCGGSASQYSSGIPSNAEVSHFGSDVLADLGAALRSFGIPASANVRFAMPSSAAPGTEVITVYGFQGRIQPRVDTFNDWDFGSSIVGTGASGFDSLSMAVAHAALQADALARRYYPNERARGRFIPEIGTIFFKRKTVAGIPYYEYSDFIVGSKTGRVYGSVPFVITDPDTIAIGHAHWVNTLPSDDSAFDDNDLEEISLLHRRMSDGFGGTFPYAEQLKGYIFGYNFGIGEYGY